MKTVLFVDDEPWFHESLRYSLESKGYQCLYATNMTDALDKLERNEIDVVVTDIMMPAGERFPRVASEEAGFHFVRKVREDRPAIPIICLSVIGDEAKIRPLRNLRKEYLRKGEVPLATVIQTIQRAARDGGEKVWRF